MPDRRPYIAGNWKLWGTRAPSSEYCEKLLALLPDPSRRSADVGICPPFTALDVCVKELEGAGVTVCAQDMSAHDEGAYTGEISAAMLLELGVDGVVLGHSERRQYNCESDRALQEKLPVALAAGLQPILCVGESEEERESGEMERKLRHQVGEAFANVSDEEIADVVIAYEPIW
ncbi:MAG: triose-phosphate isomerase, partial [Actinomycetota bacterium]|nr:triose-phosphate isomerase [Actinomycetota bacterium]